MGRRQQQVHLQLQQVEEVPKLERRPPHSLKSKAVHFVSDLTTVFLNPISDKPSKSRPRPSPHDNVNNCEHSQSDSDESSEETVDAPDTSSFTAFLYSLLAFSETETPSNNVEKIDSHVDEFKPSFEPITRDNGKRRSMFSRGRQSLSRAFNQAGRFAGIRNQDPKASSDMIVSNGNNSESVGDERMSVQTSGESFPLENLPETSEPSLLLSEKTRSVLYAALPVIVQGRKWMLLYSTWRHGISLSTLYRRSMLWPGLSLLVVGDRKGSVFGGLVEAPLRPINTRKYQGSNNSFVFSNISGHPVIFPPTGVNRYFTLCSTEYLALGGGSHFALYLDGDLLSGSSSSSETYGNPCLSHSQDFQVKEVELWGFVYASKFEEVVASSRTEVPGICHL